MLTKMSILRGMSFVEQTTVVSLEYRAYLDKKWMSASSLLTRNIGIRVVLADINNEIKTLASKGVGESCCGYDFTQTLY